ncbi:MAG: reverse transcriptase-like protein [Chloroflexi bacterium]|nr:reverse transcriptase-like protein [Chloroflexota bacterium]
MSTAPVSVRIVFDGGSIRNPGHGYGSYQLRIGEAAPRMARLDFGSPITSNEAEYLTLVHALEDTITSLEAEGVNPATARVEVLGDSQLVLKQVTGEWKVRMAHLRPLHRRAVDLVERFGSVMLTWHPRWRSVRILGH